MPEQNIPNKSDKNDRIVPLTGKYISDRYELMSLINVSYTYSLLVRAFALFNIVIIDFSTSKYETPLILTLAMKII